MNQEIPPKDTHSNAPREIPGRGYYFLGGTLIGGGIIGFTALLVWGLLASNQTDIRVLAPGVETIELPEPGEYTIFTNTAARTAETDTLQGSHCLR